MGASNPFFNTTNSFSEQSLVEDLIVESISIYGQTIFYCPRTIVNKDDILGEDSLSQYNGHYVMDVYIKNFDAYEGDGTFLSKFNLEIRDQMTFTFARRTFNRLVTSKSTILDLSRPREGDLVFSPVFKRLMIVKYVSNSPIFYQLGTLQTWDVVCEMFEYSSEILNTGVPAIDAIQTNNTLTMEHATILTNSGFTLVNEDGEAIVQGQYDFDDQNRDVFADNDEFDEEDERDNIVDWSERDPFADLF